MKNLILHSFSTNRQYRKIFTDRILTASKNENPTDDKNFTLVISNNQKSVIEHYKNIDDLVYQFEKQEEIQNQIID